MNNLVSLGLPILELSKIVMYEFWYDYLKPTYCKKLCYMDTSCSILYKKPMILLKKVKTSFENYNNELNIPLPKRIKTINLSVICVMKDKLGGKII